MTPSYDLQLQMRALLAGDATVTALVPAANIFDRHKSPEVFPKIVLGEHQEVGDDLTFDRNTTRVFSTLHVFTRDLGLGTANKIAGAVRKALVGKIMGYVDFRFESVHFQRDPDGETGHAILSFEALFWEPAE
ncbi:hypothetical protein A1351_14000 [Methylosinus sp. R-45379]|uniref:DUF3168 domain-containing protein n=1 Tax=Methylosinus sp. R-45379 TaxID=980563 RepID=UPI0007C9657F|nr:DUF3168 domain-containing protein [Methylosinus sp. R-45379]OAI26951.1 hypothetical protein A1351_14000 [Methylosinus sp. R-45379]